MFLEQPHHIYEHIVKIYGTTLFKHLLIALVNIREFFFFAGSFLFECLDGQKLVFYVFDF